MKINLYSMDKNTIIDGIAASEHLDSSGESLSIEGMDISSLGGPDSILNWEHGSKEKPAQVVGKVTFARKIMKKDDARNKREAYFWNKIKKPFVYIKAELFDGLGHSGAQDVAAMLKYKNKDKGEDSRLVVGFSIEGGKIEKKGMQVTKSIARDVAITVKPCNKVCDAELIEDDVDDDFLYKNQEYDCEILFKGESLTKSIGYRNLIIEDIKKSHFDINQKKINENKINALKTIRNFKENKNNPEIGRGVFSKVYGAGDKVVKELSPNKDKIVGFRDEMIDSDLERQVTNAEFLKDQGFNVLPSNYIKTKKGKYLVQPKIQTLKDAMESGKINSKNAEKIMNDLRVKLKSKRLGMQDLKADNVAFDSETGETALFDVSMLEVPNRYAMFQPGEGGLHPDVTSNRPFETQISEEHKRAAERARKNRMSVKKSAINKNIYYGGLSNPNYNKMKVGDTFIHNKTSTQGRSGKDIYNDPKTWKEKDEDIRIKNTKNRQEGNIREERKKTDTSGEISDLTNQQKKLIASEKNNMRKALIAGVMGAAPSALTGVAALTPESLEGKVENVAAPKRKKEKKLNKNEGNNILSRVKLNPEHGKMIADAYHNMKHTPDDENTRNAYGALISETREQFQKLMDGGLKISRMQPGQENPYKNSKELHNDIINNNHLWYFPTEQGYGSGGEFLNHPMLQGTGYKHGDKELLANDMFRIVHDINGHHIGGQSGFGPTGEHRAFLTHRQMYSPLAQRALASETLGQNSWVNFGPHGEHNRTNPSQTIYADQKSGLLPDEIVYGDWHLEDGLIKPE